jgi:hypothetical protein
LHSYYKIVDEGMEQIIKEWPKAFLVPVVDAELSDTDTIGSPMITRVEHVGQPSGTKKQRERKKKVEVQDIESDEEETHGDNGFGSPRGGENEAGQGGGEDEAEGREGGDEEAEEQGGGEATPPEDPPVVTVTLQKRKVTTKKPSARKKTCTNKPQLEATLTNDDISLVRGAMEDASEDMLRRYEEKQVELYEKIQRELKEVQQVVRLVRSVPIAPYAPSLSQLADLEDEPTPQGEPGI